MRGLSIACLILVLWVAGCGKYGPPVRLEKRQPEAAEAADPAGPADPGAGVAKPDDDDSEPKKSTP